MVRRVFGFSFVCAVSLAGCSYHVVPPQSYSRADTADPPITTIAFDQDGNPYPFDPNAFGLAIPPQPKNSNSAFSVDRWYADRGIEYDRAAVTASISDRINGQLAANPDARLVFLIHGFNNSFERGRLAFEGVRTAIRETEAENRLVFVQVHWDGLFKGKGTAPAPLTYWGKSLTYSNLAGLCGLRRVLTALPQDRDVTFLTHSRGAAVALSAATDPEWDAHIKVCPSPDRPSSDADIRLVSYAPAVGDGHIRDAAGAVQLKHYDYFDRIYAGFNPIDSATSKSRLGIRIGGRRGGDTRLGSEKSYIELIKARSQGRFDYVSFSSADHSWAAYLAARDPSECLLWAGKLIDQRPTDCSLER